MPSQEDLIPALQRHTLGKQQDLHRVYPEFITTPVAQVSQSQPSSQVALFELRLWPELFVATFLSSYFLYTSVSKKQ